MHKGFLDDWFQKKKKKRLGAGEGRVSLPRQSDIYTDEATKEVTSRRLQKSEELEKGVTVVNWTQVKHF